MGKTCFGAQEIANFLQKLGFNKDTTIYLTQSRWDNSLNVLKDIFPKTYTKVRLFFPCLRLVLITLSHLSIPVTISSSQKFLRATADLKQYSDISTLLYLCISTLQSCTS